MTDKEIISHVLIEAKSNIHLEEGNKILELNYDGLKEYFKVEDVVLVGGQNGRGN